MVVDIEIPSAPNAESTEAANSQTMIPRSRSRSYLIAVFTMAAAALIIGLSIGRSKNKNNDSDSLINPMLMNNDGEKGVIETQNNDTAPWNVTPGDALFADDDDGTMMSPEKTDTTTIDVTSFRFEPRLQSFSSDILSGYTSCSALQRDIEEAGKYLANLVIYDNIKRRSYYDYYEYGYDYYDDDAMATASPTYPAPAPSPNTPESSYDANNQVNDVEEADIVKSDGTNVFLAYGNDLVWMLVTGDIIKRFSIPGMTNDNNDDDDDDGLWHKYSSQRIKGLLLNRNRNELVVIVSYESSHDYKFIEGSMTASHVYSLSDGDVILKTSQVYRGRYKTSRMIGNDVHIVTITDIYDYYFRNELSRWHFPNLNDDEYRQAAYQRAVMILPSYSEQLLVELMSDANGTVHNESCNSVVRLSDMIGGIVELDGEHQDPTGGKGLLNSFARTASFDISVHSSLVSGAFLPTYSLDVYVNKDNLILAGKGWRRDADTLAYIDFTYLLQFQLSGSSSKPIGIGKVPGYFLNQFSIDEYKGYLRIATTISAQWRYSESERSWQEISKSQSQIAILQQNNGILEEIATLTNLGIGEDIYSVRFFREKGFVVTFERIDPFFTIDLSDPKNPFVAGELKISGFSNYLHLIEDDQFVLTVGQDADETTGQQTGLQISLFDVRDFPNPLLIHKTVVKGWSYSDAQSDHLSFRYFSNTLILPVETRNHYGGGYDGFYIYNVNIDDGITAQGKVTHAKSKLMLNSCWSMYYVPSRSMVFEGQLMTIKGHNVMMSDGLVKPKKIWRLNLDSSMKKSSYGCNPWFGW